jgi:hypothetical protein
MKLQDLGGRIAEFGQKDLLSVLAEPGSAEADFPLEALMRAHIQPVMAKSWS